jgi:hypothetical protein
MNKTCGIVLTAVIAITWPAIAGAQAGHVHTDHTKHQPSAPNWTGLSEKAKGQIQQVEQAMANLKTPESARAAGFRPAFGLIPTMGTHWVNRGRVLDTAHFDLTNPDHLMFAPVNGKETLVGIAYAYHGAPGGATPDGFDGELDLWHEHPDLAPGEQSLTMLHVWFVPSPDGPFAGHNPWLPYYAVGLEPPDPARLADPAESRKIRALALALAETVQPLGGGRLLRALPQAQTLVAETDAHRAAIKSLIPALEAAQQKKDAAAWDAAATEAVSHGDKIRAAYLAAIPLPRARQRLEAFYEEMLSGHHGTHR